MWTAAGHGYSKVRAMSMVNIFAMLILMAGWCLTDRRQTAGSQRQGLMDSGIMIDLIGQTLFFGNFSLIDMSDKTAHLVTGDIPFIGEQKNFVDTGGEDNDILLHHLREVF